MIEPSTFLRFATSDYLALLLLFALLCGFIYLCTKIKEFKIFLPALLIWLTGLVVLFQSLEKSYYITILSGEDDKRAEAALRYLQKHLSSREVTRRVMKGSKDNNERYYIAVIAAERGLRIDDITITSAPSFFRSNAYSSFASNLHFPITYEAFLVAYQLDRGKRAVASVGATVPIATLMRRYNDGILAYARRDYGSAISTFTSVINLGLSNSATYFSRASAYAYEGDLRNAMSDIDNSIRLEPTNYDAWCLKGYVEALHTDFSNAIVDYTQAINIAHASSADAYAYRGMCYAKEGNYQRGIVDCTEALRLNGKSIAGLNNLAWLLVVSPIDELRDGASGVKFATEACESTSWQDANCLGTLAAAYAEVGSFEKAILWQESAIAIGLPTEDLKRAQERLKAYRAGKPFRESVKQSSGNQ